MIPCFFISRVIDFRSIRAARAVMERTPHVMLMGTGADAFIERSGLPTEAPAYFETEKRRKQLEKVRDRDDAQLDHDGKHGTVGAVALDKRGNLAAGTSTGGMTNKRWGRVGDSSIVGAGTFARNATAAVSCTGHGEFFIRDMVAAAVSMRMELAGQTLHEAAHAVVFERLEPIGGRGGLVAIDAKGHITAPFNTPGMFRGHRLSDGRRGVAIWKATAAKKD